jgi:Mrp family chromosome partitioning ATPase
VFGALELDQSVAETAEIWIDPVEDQIARADQARREVPRPHVDGGFPTAPTDVPNAGLDVKPDLDSVPGTPDQGLTDQDAADQDAVDQLAADVESATRDSVSGHTMTSDTPDQGGLDVGVIEAQPAKPHPDPLQHIHTAYAGAFADASVMDTGVSIEQTIDLQTSSQPQEIPLDCGAATGQAQQDLSKSDPPKLSQEITPTTTDSQVSDDFQPDLTAAASDRSVMAESAEATDAESDAATSATYLPFQAVWEVDVFDVPSPVADLFFEGALFQQIAERMSDAVGSGLRSVLITSAKPGEGRSSVAIGMAMAAAAAGIRVALVDADTESPSLADELRLDLQYGWVDVIRRGLPIREIAVQAVEDGVTLIPLMPPGVRPAATAFELVQLMDLLKSNFELIILDGPTSLSPALYQCVAKVDSAVVVRDMKQTNDRSVAELSNRLRSGGVRGVGVVENFV